MKILLGISQGFCEVQHESLKASPEELHEHLNCEVFLISLRRLLEHPRALKNHTNSMSNSAMFEVPRASGGGKIGPRRSLGRSLDPLELLEASWSALGSLLERSWSPPWPKNKVGNGSWPLLKAFGDWFQLSWGPQGHPRGAKNAPKSSSKCDPSWKENLEN